MVTTTPRTFDLDGYRQVRADVERELRARFAGDIREHPEHAALIDRHIRTEAKRYAREFVGRALPEP